MHFTLLSGHMSESDDAYKETHLNVGIFTGISAIDFNILGISLSPCLMQSSVYKTEQSANATISIPVLWTFICICFRDFCDFTFFDNL